jgi:hypothetical protein
MDGTNGQLSCLLAYGQSRKWGVWNAYNRKPIVMLAGDATASWTYSTNTNRQSNNAAANTAAVFCGLPEEGVSIRFGQKYETTNNNSSVVRIGVGVNSTTTISGLAAEASPPQSAGGAMRLMLTAEHQMAPALGLNNINLIECGSTATTTFYGTEANNRMVIQYQG